MRKNTLKELTFAAMLGGAYAALTMLLPIPQYAGVQFRLAEALTLLPFLIPAATPGLFVGCFIANILSPYGLLDIIAGSAATLLACLWTQRMKNRRLATIPPVVCNAVIVGGVIAFAMTGFGPGFWVAYAINALSVGLGEFVVCYVLGELLLDSVVKIPVFRSLMPADRVALMKKG
jgi:uncharacterized membrane protein